MIKFKFLQGTPHNPYIRLRWWNIEIDGYRFRIQSHHDIQTVASLVRDLNRFYMRVWSDDINRDRLLELLKERFADAVNVLLTEEIRRR